jgi:hypothetical protein
MHRFGAQVTSDNLVGWATAGPPDQRQSSPSVDRHNQTRRVRVCGCSNERHEGDDTTELISYKEASLLEDPSTVPTTA